jgi:hypothetical protein
MNTVALIDENNVVKQISVIPEDKIPTFKDYLSELGFTGNWLLCDINSHKGKNRDGSPGPAFRKNYPKIGFIYDPVLDAFIEPKSSQYPSWILDVDSGFWKTPVPRPSLSLLDSDKKYAWDEATVSWIQVPR